MKMLSRSVVVMVGAIVLCAVRAAADPGSELRPAVVALRALGSTLAGLSDAPAALTGAEQADLKSMLADGRAAVSGLARQLIDKDVSGEYLADLAAAGSFASRLAARTKLEAADLAKLRTVVSDLRAKRRWADANPDMPSGPVALEVAAQRNNKRATGIEIVYRSALADDRAVATVFDAKGKKKLQPGLFHFWVRTRTAPKVDGEAREFAADGTVQHLELKAP